MPNNKSLIVLCAVLVVISGILSAPAPASASDREKVLYAFEGGRDGLSPSAVIFDTAGNLYGATFEGGNTHCDPSAGCGTVFKLEPGAKGKWSKTVLHTFNGAEDGASPSGLVFDAAGNLYGTTIYGIGGGAKGYGTVFKLAPGTNGKWTETVLHIFNDHDGSAPSCTLIFDKAGNLYGITPLGGAYGFGTVFKLVPGMNGKWTETVLHSFDGKDGNRPTSALVFDSAGSLYGTTLGGGDVNYCSPNGCGTVFKLVPATDGKWTHTVLHSFRGKDGSIPVSSLVFDTAGNLYGTTEQGGDLNSNTCLGYGCGTVFKLAPGANGSWTEQVMHRFHGWTDGFYPTAGLIFDTAGNLYGTTWYGGKVFKLAPGTNGKWTETVLHGFKGKDGWFPYAGLVFDAAGNLYGTTSLGGELNNCQSQFGNGCGVVFEITP